MSGARLLLDSNLTVLLCAGSAGRGRLPRHKRLSAYDDEDFRLLAALVASCREVIFSPNVLTEASNLVRQAPENLARELSSALAKLVDDGREHHIPSSAAVRHDAFLRLGLTDAVLLHVLDQHVDVVLVTADHELHVAALFRARKAVNFNYLRDQRLDFR